MGEKIRLVLIDHQALWRAGLAELLERRAGMSVVGVTGNPDDGIRLVREQKPDLALMDLRMPPADGVDLLCRLRTAGGDTPAVILTASNAREDMARALRAGARGYLLKDMEFEDVVGAIQRAARGELVVASAMRPKFLCILQLNQRNPSSRDLLTALTQREREILEHVAHGESNKVIARTLTISHETVKLHVQHILAKLHLSSRLEAAILAVEQKATSSCLACEACPTPNTGNIAELNTNLRQAKNRAPPPQVPDVVARSRVRWTASAHGIRV